MGVKPKHCIGLIVRAGQVALVSLVMIVPLYGQISLLESLERRLPELKGQERASALNELVTNYSRVDLKKAAHYLASVREWMRDDPPNEIHAYLLAAAGGYCNRSGNLDSAIYYYNSARKLSRTDTTLLLKIFSGLGYAYISAGKAEEGVKTIFEGLRVLENRADPETEFKLRTNVAWAYLELKRYRDCIDYGRESIRRMSGTPFDWIALYNINNVAVSYGALGILDSARLFIQQGLAIAERTGDVQMMANGHFVLGNIYSEAGEYSLALAEYLKAKPFREKVGNPVFIVSDLYTIADLYNKTGQYNAGVQAAQEALAIAQQYKLRLKLEGAYYALARNYEGLGDFKNASRYYKEWAIAKDSVYQHSNAESIAAIRTKFETDQKEQQLALQNARILQQETELQQTYIVIAGLSVTLVLVFVIYWLIRLRQKQEREVFYREAQIQATIQSQETERRRFARDLHDGMGQLISALRLAIHRIHNDATLEERVEVVNKAEGLLNDMHQEIRSIAFNLMPQTLVQNGLVPALREMANRLIQSAKVAVRVSSFDVPERLPEVQEISLYRVIQEWINNVIKHANADAIHVQFVGFEDEINITIEDDGPGFDPTVLSLGQGNGWKNIHSRLNLIRGHIEVDSRAGRKGTTVMIRVPLQPKLPEARQTLSANTQ